MEYGDIQRGRGGRFGLGGDRYQGLEGLKLSVVPAKFLVGGGSDQECSPSTEVPGVAEGRALEYPCPERKVIWQEVAHVLDPNHIEEAPVRPENVFASLLEDGSLSDLGPSLLVLKPTVLAEVEEQVYETVLCKEVCHSLDPRATWFIDIHVESPEDNGVPKAPPPKIHTN